jgi:mono/diheme cytochrome c family protein
MRRASTALITAFALTLMGIVAIAGATASAQNPGGSPEARTVVNPVKPTPESIAAGKASFLRTCKFCHGEDSKGSASTAPKTMTPPSDLTDAKWDRGSTDGEIFAVIRSGAGPKFEMKGQKDTVLKDTDVWNIVNYLRSIGPQAKK